MEGLAEAIGFEWTSLPMVVFTGGFLGGCTGFFMCWYANVISFPLNIGGKPFNSWPAWIPITYRADDFGRGARGRVRNDRHERAAAAIPSGFQRCRVLRCASTDRFFLCIKARDKKFDLAQTKAFLEEMKPHGVFEVEA